jgi:tRNA pseudouridine38-40 synthase
MGQRIRGIIRYDGTNFAGWQVQPNQRTVQGALEEALGRIAGEPIRVISAGRTDAGTHALGQVFSCDWSADVPLDQLRRRLSQMLVPDARIESIEPAPDDFHATWHAKSKRYAYVVNLAREPDPFAVRYSWCIFRDDLDRAHVNELALRLTGKHDFAGFCSNGAQVDDTVRTLISATIADGPVVGPAGAQEYLRLEFEGDGFLYKMVRNLTGTIIEIALGKLPESTLDERLHGPGPYLGYSAPARGLFLMEVKY